MSRRVLVVLASLGLLLGAACTPGNNFRDLENVDSHDPDYSRNYNNLDLHPNVAVHCLDGWGFWTTTREYTAAQRFPEIDDFCKTQVKKG